MKSKFTLRKKCLEKREIFFKKKGNECLKLKDIEVIILEIKSKLKISSIGIYYPIKSEISPLKLIEICENLSIKICLPVPPSFPCIKILAKLALTPGLSDL